MVSLFGAGGTSAAYRPQSRQLRTLVAERLGLVDTDVPWHVDRDGLAEFGWLCVTITATCAKLARNIIDLSRTEIGEVFEPYFPHRGASSTMPQKVNPISSEILIGPGRDRRSTGVLAGPDPGGRPRAGRRRMADRVAGHPPAGLTGWQRPRRGPRHHRRTPRRPRPDAATSSLDGGLVLAEAR